MQTVEAASKITTRLKPAAQVCEPPKLEVVTSHAALCPVCGNETRVGLDLCGAVVYGGCVHLKTIQQRGETTTVQSA